MSENCAALRAPVPREERRRAQKLRGVQQAGARRERSDAAAGQTAHNRSPERGVQLARPGPSGASDPAQRCRIPGRRLPPGPALCPLPEHQAPQTIQSEQRSVWNGEEIQNRQHNRSRARPDTRPQEPEPHPQVGQPVAQLPREGRAVRPRQQHRTEAQEENRQERRGRPCVPGLASARGCRAGDCCCRTSCCCCYGSQRGLPRRQDGSARAGTIVARGSDVQHRSDAAPRHCPCRALRVSWRPWASRRPSGHRPLELPRASPGQAQPSQPRARALEAHP